MRISRNFELRVIDHNEGAATAKFKDLMQQELRQPHCIALGEADGKLISGSRITKDMPINECRKALATLKAQYPNAGVYLSAVVDGRHVQELHQDADGHFELSYFQVVYDIKEGAHRCSGVPLGRRWENEDGARAELSGLKQANRDAYVQACTLFFHKNRPGNIEEYRRLKATVLAAA